MARRWDPAVRDRFARLLAALGEERQNSLPLIGARPDGIVAGLAVQDGNLPDRNPGTGERVTVEDLVRIARDELHLDYLFWGTEEPYGSGEVLPFLRGLPRD